MADISKITLNGSDTVYNVKDATARSSITNNIPVTFTVTLASNNWSSNSQTITNTNILTGNYAYTVSAEPASFANYSAAQIYALDVTTTNQMTFNCKKTPTSNINVNIIRTVVVNF